AGLSGATAAARPIERNAVAASGPFSTTSATRLCGPRPCARSPPAVSATNVSRRSYDSGVRPGARRAGAAGSRMPAQSTISSKCKSGNGPRTVGCVADATLQHECFMSDTEAMQAPVVDAVLRRATIEVLSERGFSGLTLERVAEVAGRARSTLWRQGLGRDALIRALVGELAEDFRSTMYPVLTSHGTGRERLTRALEALCELLDRHLPLMLATDEAFHQDTGPGQPPDYLHPLIRFPREGTDDASLPPIDDPVLTADVAFNAVAWPYVHLRGHHGWPAEKARAAIVGVVLDGIGAAARPTPTGKEQ